MANIGKRSTLTVVRGASQGVYLDGGALGEILLPRRYLLGRVMPGDRVEVFIYRDSEDRLVATTETPRVMVGEVATLRVVGIHSQAGAFLDWGLAKDLLLPFREQTAPVRAGQEVLVRVFLDPKSQRIVASMKMGDAGSAAPADLQAGQRVEFVLTEKTPLGYKAMVEGRHQGLLYHESIIRPVTVGQTLTGFIRAIRPDGRIDLALQEGGFRRVAPLAMEVVRALEQAGGRLQVDDNTPPEAIREAFGVSKKAFKQALGTLYKSRRIRFCHPGIELLDNTNWSPGNEPGPQPRKAVPLPQREPRPRPPRHTGSS
jgi:predicted RNA-binding protein (virulence factor B family)